MAQIEWNDFVDTHKTGHGVGIRSLLKLKPLGADGKRPVPVRSVLLKTVAGTITDDWSVMSVPSKVKIGKKTVSGTVYNFIFVTIKDQAAVIQAIGAQSHRVAPKTVMPFATYNYLGDLMPIGYDRMAVAIATSKPKPRKPKAP